MKRVGSAVVTTLGLLVSSSALADPILLPPDTSPADQALAQLAAGYQRQQDVFATRELGLSLDTWIKADDVSVVKNFFAQTAVDDFQTCTGQHPFAVVDSFDEYGDEGNFAGIASVGVAARLMILRAENAPSAELAAARDAAVRAARAWHVYGAIGGAGVVARGVRRVSPLDPAAPPLPGQTPELVPLADANGNPMPTGKTAVWRAPVASGFDGWIWLDDTSKDQVSGYALAVAWLWDALHDDPEVPADVPDAMASDLAAFAHALMKTAPELGIDLCIRDADGRLTNFHDLNPRQLNPDSVMPENIALRNGFNAALALGIIRAAYHVSGDPEIGAYYYQDLVGQRNLPALAVANAGVIFMGAPTNYSNVNMLAIALATLGRFETDTYVRASLQELAEHGFWSTSDDHDVSHVRQAWFDAVYGAYSASPPGAELRSRIAENLGGFQTPPAFQRDRINCDPAEIDAGVCTAVDGTTQIILSKTAGHGGSVVARDILPMSIRPDSDFEWRSDPHEVNGAGNNRLNPGGDFLAAYWLARLSDGDDTSRNLSPQARAPLPYSLADGGTDDAGESSDAEAPAASATAATGGGGCGCAIPGRSAAGSGAALLAAACVGGLLRRRRDRKP